jgi:hypothetical protein
LKHPFELKGVDGMLPAGEYRVLTDEELIDGLSFLAYRRVATLILSIVVLPDSPGMLTVDPQDLAAAQERDRAAPAAKEPYVRLRDVGYSRRFDHVGDNSGVAPIAAVMPRCGEPRP